MRKATHDNAIRFRAPTVLVRELSGYAAERGMTLSAYMRSIVLEKMGLH